MSDNCYGCPYYGNGDIEGCKLTIAFHKKHPNHTDEEYEKYMLKNKIITQEERKLLLVDLAARLPYGVKATWDGKFSLTVTPYIYYLIVSEYISLPKLLLRPMSSMTEEEKVQLSQYACIGEDLNGEFIDEVQRKDCAAYIDWLNKNHFDYRGLILKGIALEATKYIYKI